MGDSQRDASRVPLGALACVLLVATALLIVVVGETPSDAPARDGARSAAAAGPPIDDGAAAGDSAATERRVPSGDRDGAAVGASAAGAAATDRAWTREPLTTESAAVAAEATQHVFADPLRQTLPRPKRTIGIGGGMRGRAGGHLGGGPRVVTGTVLDAVTGAPIVGAEVVCLLAKPGGFARRYTASESQADGTFRVGVTQHARDRTDVLVRATSYRALRVALTATPAEWVLTPIDGPERGTVRGRAETPEGTPLSGMLLVVMTSENGDRGDQYAWSDVAGRFELPGLRPGRWRLSLERSRVTEVAVAAGGVSAATLVAERPAAPPPPVAGTDRRSVEVSGLADGTPLRADAGPGVYWRAVVRDGVARFELPFGLWVLTLDRRGGAVRAITVHDEPGALRMRFTPDLGDAAAGAENARDQ